MTIPAFCGRVLILSAFAALAAAAEPPILRIENGTHIAAIRQAAVDADGRWLLTASEDKTARVWRTDDGAAQTVFRPPIGPGNQGKLFAAALTADGETAAVAGWSEDNDIYLFRRRDGTLLGRIAGLPNVVNRLAFSADGKQLAVALWGRNGVRLYASADGWKKALRAGEDTDYGGDTYGLAISRDGRQLVTSSHDRQLRLYELRQGGLWLKAKATLAPPGLPWGVQFSPDGRLIAVGFEGAARVSVLSAGDLAIAFEADTAGIAEGGLGAVVWAGDYLCAGGSARLALARHVVRCWRNSGRGGGRDHVVATDSVTDLAALADDRFVHASASGSWGVISAAGANGPQVASARADFRANWQHFAAATDGRAVAVPFAFAAGAPAQFDLAGLAWRRSPLPLAAPLLAGKGVDVRDWKDSYRPSLNGRPIMLADGEMSLAMAVDPGGAVALGTTWHLRLHGLDGRELWKAATPAACFLVHVTADARWVIGAFGDGTLRWFRRNTGEEVLALYPHPDRQRWVAWTPEGRFAASDGGDRLVGWQVNHGPDQAPEFLNVGQFSERYHDPAGVAAILAAAAPAAVPAAVPVAAAAARPPGGDLRKGIRPPPAVRITSPEGGKADEGDRIKVAIAVQDRGGGVDEVRLYHNGKLVAEQGGSRGGKRKAPAIVLRRGIGQLDFDVALESGRNILRAVALGADRTESEPAELVLQVAGLPAKPKLHVLTVGVNQYRNAALNLDYSVPDARSVAGFFRGERSRLFADIEVTEVYDADATKANVFGQFQRLRQSRPEDAVVIYLAGHGETVQDDWYFIPHEVTTPERREVLQTQGISSRELSEAVKSVPARKVVVVIDACKSGAATAGFRGLEERRALAQLSRSTGTHLIAATTKEQLAMELETLGHGVFTYTLLEGLQGKAAGSGRDVTARKLMVYVEQALPELTKRYRAEEQYPVVSSTGMDFPLVVQ